MCVYDVTTSPPFWQRDPHVDDEDEDPFMSDDYSSTPMTPGALEAVDKLVSQRFQDRVYLICVAAPQVLVPVPLPFSISPYVYMRPSCVL